MPRLENTEALAKLRAELVEQRGAVAQRISVCGGTGCRAAKASGCIDALKKEIARRRLSDEVEVRQTGCYGLCERGPIVVAGPKQYCYLGVQASDAAEIVEQTMVAGKPIERLMYRDEHDPKAPVAPSL